MTYELLVSIEYDGTEEGITAITDVLEANEATSAYEVVDT